MHVNIRMLLYCVRVLRARLNELVTVSMTMLVDFCDFGTAHVYDDAIARRSPIGEKFEAVMEVVKR